MKKDSILEKQSYYSLSSLVTRFEDAIEREVTDIEDRLAEGGNRKIELKVDFSYTDDYRTRTCVALEIEDGSFDAIDKEGRKYSLNDVTLSARVEFYQKFLIALSDMVEMQETA